MTSTPTKDRDIVTLFAVALAVIAQLSAQGARHDTRDGSAARGLAAAPRRCRVPRVRRADSPAGETAEQRRAGEEIIAITGFVGASACVFIFSGIADPVRGMIVLGFAGFFNDFVMPAAWAGTMDVGGRYSGTVSGAMNMMGSIAGALSVLFVGCLLAWTNDWTLAYYVSATIYLVGAVCWLFLDSHTPVERPLAARAAA
jgi:MFS family permease